MWLRRTSFQQELADEARKAIAGAWTLEDVRTHDPARVRDHRVWSVVDGMGWRDMLVPEDAGGLGLGPVEVAAVLEAAGAALMPGPLFDTVVAGPLVGAALGRPAAAASALAFAEPGSAGEVAWTGTTISGERISGTKTLVAYPGEVDELLVVAAADGAPALAVVRADDPGVTVAPVPTVDRAHHPADVTLDEVAVVAQLSGAEASAMLDGLGTQARCMHAARLLGVGEQLLETARAFACTREQFGRSIGSFQSIQHLLADMHVAVATARAACYVVQASIAEGAPEAAHQSRVAKGRTSQVGRTVAEGALQVLGGIGFTTDHDLHLYFKHALSLQASWGDERQHATALATDLIERVVAQRAPAVHG